MSVIQRIVFFVAASSACGSAQAQQAQCTASDLNCRAANAIFKTLNDTPRQQGLREFVVGTVCNDAALIDKGRSLYMASIGGVVAAAKVQVQTDLATFTFGQVEAVKGQVDFGVRAARNSQAAGMIAGLESAFSLYPRSRAEYCVKIKSQIAPSAN